MKRMLAGALGALLLFSQAHGQQRYSSPYATVEERKNEAACIAEEMIRRGSRLKPPGPCNHAMYPYAPHKPPTGTDQLGPDTEIFFHNPRTNRWVMAVPEPRFVEMYWDRLRGRSVEVPLTKFVKISPMPGGTRLAYIVGYGVACVLSPRVPVAPLAGGQSGAVSIYGQADRVVQTTLTNGDQQQDVNTLVLENCHIGEGYDSDVLYRSLH